MVFNEIACNDEQTILVIAQVVGMSNGFVILIIFKSIVPTGFFWRARDLYKETTTASWS